MATNVQVLTKALAILKERGIEVEQVPNWQTRTGSSRPLIPEAVVVHHTGDASTPLSVIRDGRTGLPGPLANFLVGQSGRVYLVSAGYSNNAGYGGEDNFALAKAGKLSAEVRPPSSDGSWSANSHAWSIEADGRGAWPANVRANVVKVAAALHLAHGWTAARVIAHKELTRRKPGDPGDDMGQVRAEVLAQIKAWSPTPPPPPAKPPTPKPPAPKPGAVRIKVLVANLQSPRFGGPKDSTAQGKFIAQFNPDVILCCESIEADRNAIRAAGRTKLVFPSLSGSVGLIWADFKYSPRKTVEFGDGYHGAVASDLTLPNGRKLRVISTHTRPKAVATDAKKKADIQKAASLKSGLTLLGGDLAKNKPGGWLTGWKRLTPYLDTMDDKGTQYPDSLWVNGSGVKVIDTELINPGGYSDHRWLLVTLEIAA